MYSKSGYNLALRSNEEKEQYGSASKYTNGGSQEGHGSRNK